MKKIVLLAAFLSIFISAYAESVYFPYSGLPIIEPRNAGGFDSITLNYLNKDLLLSTVLSNTSDSNQSIKLIVPVIECARDDSFVYQKRQWQQSGLSREEVLEKELEYVSSIMGTVFYLSDNMVLDSEVAASIKYPEFDYIFSTTVDLEASNSMEISVLIRDYPISMSGKDIEYTETFVYSLDTARLAAFAPHSLNINVSIPKPTQDVYQLDNFFFQVWDDTLYQFHSIASPSADSLSDTDGSYLFQWEWTDEYPDRLMEINWGIVPSDISQKQIYSLIDAIYLLETDKYFKRQSRLFEYMDNEEVMESLILSIASSRLYSRDDIGYYKLLINSLFAFESYDFETDEWKGFFTNFSWYEGETTDVELSENRQALLDELLEEMPEETNSVESTENKPGWLSGKNLIIVLIICGNIVIFVIFLLILSRKNRN